MRRGKPLPSIIAFGLSAILAVAWGCGGGDPCADIAGRCEISGTDQCQGAVIQSCVKDAEGCLAWVFVMDCSQSGQTCQLTNGAGQCVTTCADQCGAGASRCAEDVVQACSMQLNGCLAWTAGTDCGANGQTCQVIDELAQCVAGCADTCPVLADARCNGTVIQICRENVDGCLGWDDQVDCASVGKICDTSAGVPVCVDAACPGFAPVEQSMRGNQDGTFYLAADTATEPQNLLSLEFYDGFGDPEPTFSPGTFALAGSAAEQNYATCGTCLRMLRQCTTESCATTLLATGGTLQIDAFGPDGEPFSGSLRDVELVEVTIDPNSYASTPVEGGLTWCIDTMPFYAIMRGYPPCASDADCAAAAPAIHCDPGSRQCVACLDDADCSAPATCSTAGTCVDLTDCDSAGFTASSEWAFLNAANGVHWYEAGSSPSAPSDWLIIELWEGLGDPPFPAAPGTYPLGLSADERNYGFCSRCVLIYQGCNEAGGCQRAYFATSGVLNLTAIGDVGAQLTGSLSGVYLIEVTIDPDSFESTPVPDGLNWCIQSYSFSQPIQVSP